MSFARCIRMGHWVCTPARASASGACAARRTRGAGGAQRRSVAAHARPAARELLNVAPENRQEVAVILDQAEQAAKAWALVYSRFVTPPVAADALAAISQVRGGERRAGGMLVARCLHSMLYATCVG